MVNLNPTHQVSSPVANVPRPSASKGEEASAPEDHVRIDGPRIGFEPWLGGGPDPAQVRRDAVAPPTGGVPEPVATIEPWLRGELTDDPKVGPNFADKLVTTFGEQAILSIEDGRVHGVGGYFLEGWESVGGGDFVTNICLGRLGDKWDMTEYGTFELKAGGVRQELSFDMSMGQTRLESSYQEQVYDTSTSREVLTLDRDGVMRRDQPPAGL